MQEVHKKKDQIVQKKLRNYSKHPGSLYNTTIIKPKNKTMQNTEQPKNTSNHNYYTTSALPPIHGIQGIWPHKVTGLPAKTCWF